MADPVATVVNTAKDVVKKPISWFKGSKVAFVIFLLIVVCLAIRFRNEIAALIFKAGPPGRWIVGKLDNTTTGGAA